MRLWSIHPKYLDAKGLVALWREALLARHVLEGKTIGYRFHPQLERFTSLRNPTSAINRYLKFVHSEAVSRRYNFDAGKFENCRGRLLIKISIGQLEYEFEHLLSKLISRDNDMFRKLSRINFVEPHPLFCAASGPVEPWERPVDGSFRRKAS